MHLQLASPKSHASAPERDSESSIWANGRSCTLPYMYIPKPTRRVLVATVAVLLAVLVAALPAYTHAAQISRFGIPSLVLSFVVLLGVSARMLLPVSPSKAYRS